MLKRACEYLEIPYYRGKEKYWLKKHHTLFGNISAKIHLYQRNEENYKKLKDTLTLDSSNKKIDIEEIHQSIYYNKLNDSHLESIVESKVNDSDHIKRILDVLNHNDILKSELVEKLEINQNKLEKILVQLQKEGFIQINEDLITMR